MKKVVKKKTKKATIKKDSLRDLFTCLVNRVNSLGVRISELDTDITLRYNLIEARCHSIENRASELEEKMTHLEKNYASDYTKLEKQIEKLIQLHLDIKNYASAVDDSAHNRMERILEKLNILSSSVQADEKLILRTIYVLFLLNLLVSFLTGALL